MKYRLYHLLQKKKRERAENACRRSLAIVNKTSFKKMTNVCRKMFTKKHRQGPEQLIYHIGMKTLIWGRFGGEARRLKVNSPKDRRRSILTPLRLKLTNIVKSTVFSVIKFLPVQPLDIIPMLFNPLREANTLHIYFLYIKSWV